jgi:hypothetical protein
MERHSFGILGFPEKFQKLGFVHAGVSITDSLTFRAIPI